jgi:hypothetical protein
LKTPLAIEHAEAHPADESRRRLLKKAAVGGALVAPVAWSAPTLLLQASPAAAQSPGGPGGPGVLVGPNIIQNPTFIP